MSEWRQIACAPDYEVSDAGLIRRATPHKLSSRWCADRIKSVVINHAGYRKVHLSIAVNGQRSGITRRVARLVAEAFIGVSVGDANEVNHKNGIKTDDRVENLEWSTRVGNVRHSFAMGLVPRESGSAHHNAKLTDAQVAEVRSRYRRYDRSASSSVLSKEFGVSGVVISRIIRGKSYVAGAEQLQT